MSDDELRADRRIAARLPRTWDAFFSRFGRLTPVQRASILPILKGDDVLVCAPTAGGKTEATCAPLVERYMQPGQKWTVLYLSPTRALVNDLYGRLCPCLEQLSLSVARRTGEHRDGMAGDPNVLITTPESFDSLLCRGRRDNGHVLANVRAIVLDEIHLLHGTARGEQVRWLLERHRRLRRYAIEQGWAKGCDPQIVGLSATVASPDSVLAAYLPRGVLVTVAGGRELLLADDRTTPACTEDVLPAYLSTTTIPEKILVFANSRERTDALTSELAARLAGTRYVVAGHHGSLAQQERESTERQMRDERAVVVVATSTLEIGIDIGDVDVVVLDAPPPNVPGFLQRIGRGNRRSDHTRLLLCAGTPAEWLQQLAMFRAAVNGELGVPERGPSFAVAIQQAASFIYQGQEHARSRALVAEYLGSCWTSQSCSVERLIDHLIDQGELVPCGQDRLRLGEPWLERASRGEIHGNIESAGGISVKDQSTGDDIAIGVKYRAGRKMEIAGQQLRVMAVRPRELEVRRERRPGDERADWTYAKGAFLMGAGRAVAVRKYLGLSDEVWPAIATDDGFAVFHFGGATTRAVLELIGTQSGDRLRANGWFLRVAHLAKPQSVVDSSAALIDLTVEQEIGRLERVLGRPRANRVLPREVRAEEVRGWLDLDGQLMRIIESRWELAGNATAEALRTLYDGL